MNVDWLSIEDIVLSHVVWILVAGGELIPGLCDNAPPPSAAGERDLVSEVGDGGKIDRALMLMHPRLRSSSSEMPSELYFLHRSL